jgi:hypothetical protein
LKKLALNNGKDLTLKISYLDYSYSLIYNITEVKYCINFYDEYNNPIAPTTLSLSNFHVICHMKSIINNINFESISNIYKNKYFFCIEYFNIDEKITFGIKIYNTKSIYNKDFDFYFFKENIFNFKNKKHKNDSKFDPLLINEEYTALENKIFSLKSSYQGETNETITLKRSFIMRPVCNPKTRIKVLKNNSNININIIKILIIYLSLQFIYFVYENSIKYNNIFNTFYLKNLALDNKKDLTLKISYLDYSYSLKYKITEVKYCINFYDEYNNPIVPTVLSLYNFHVICHMRTNINFESFPNIYKNKYFFCIEYFNID